MSHMKSEIRWLILETKHEASRQIQPPVYAFILYALKRLCTKLFSLIRMSPVMKAVSKSKNKNKPVAVVFK